MFEVGGVSLDEGGGVRVGVRSGGHELGGRRSLNSGIIVVVVVVIVIAAAIAGGGV